MKLSRIIAVFVFAAVLLPLVYVPAQEKKGQEKRAIEKFMESFNEPIRIQESKPVTVKDARFVLVAQTNWQPAKPGNAFEPMVATMVAPIEIQLRITNLGKSAVVFPTSKAFGITILNADGKEVKARRVRNGETVTRPVLLPAGVSYSLCPRAELRWDEKTKASEFLFYDGTGSQSVVGPLVPGRYKLFVWYSVSADKQEKNNGGDAMTWVGKAVTHEVPIEVLDSKTRGYPPANELYIGGFTEPLVIRESKPVTVNDAKFVVVAQTDWKPGKTKPVAIDLQLRITNLGTTDVVFPTFDTFGVRILNADGNRIMPRGGRNFTRFTRPFLLPGGVSFSLARESAPLFRRAELRWDAGAKGSELDYYDGTGSITTFGPLYPGRYKLAFWYGVGSKGLFKTERAAATWLGDVVTDDVVIEVLHR